jgi:hypothetical protein
MDDMPSVDSSYADLEQPYDWQHVPKYRGGNRVTRNKLNPVAVKKPSLKLPIRGVSKRLVSGTARVASGGPVDTGYWNLVVGAMFLLFLLYIVAHNEVQTWANILFWSPAKAVQVGDSPLTPGSAASAAAAGPPAIGAPLVNPISNTLGQLQTMGFFPQQFQGVTPQQGLIGWLNGAAIPAGTGTNSPVTGAGTGGFQSSPMGSMLKRWGIIK